MPLKHHMHRSHGASVALSLTITLLAATTVTAQPLAGAESSLDLRYRHQQVKGPAFTRGADGSRLERAIQASAATSLWELGTATSWQALLDCQAGSYPGSNFGVLGSAQSRPEAQPDHCRRF
jgi:hypothetical protein